jgi:hypothetical protein
MQPGLAAAGQVVSQLLPAHLPVASALVYATRGETPTVAVASASGVQIDPGGPSDRSDGTVAEVSARGQGITGASPTSTLCAVKY